MAAFPCPYCDHGLASGDDAEAKLERCPKCGGSLLIAYRHRLMAAHGKVSGGVLYEAIDDGFGEHVAVLFVDNPGDKAALERFVDGSRLFADLGGRGLVKIHDVGRGTHAEPRAYVVMDWLEGGTLDKRVQKRGALDQAALLELVDTLLTGVGKAHRAMPMIIHGHIHPGKIGFRQQDEAVLFGFEWATQVSAQASTLADSYAGKDQTDERRGPIGDLRQLALVFFYAATGEWLGESELDRQRERVRARLTGPLGQLVDRMLGAGLDGYKSAVEAAIDFEQLKRGDNSWQAPARARHDRSDERMGTAWVDDDEDDDNEDIEELDAFEELEASLRPTSVAPPATHPSVDWERLVAQRRAEALAQSQAQAQAQPNSGRAVVIGIFVVIMIGTCVAGIVADVQDHSKEQVYVQPPPPVVPIELPEFPELPELEPPIEPLQSSQLVGTFRYKGKVTGPPSAAGLRIGHACEVWVEPNLGSRLNCRWYIDCGMPMRRIYGGGSVGFSTCEIDQNGGPLRAQDEEDDPADGAFLADFSTDPPMIIVEDRWIEPPVRAIITIAGGGATTSSVPDTQLAPRDRADVIQQRIERGESPVIEAGVFGFW